MDDREDQERPGRGGSHTPAAILGVQLGVVGALLFQSRTGVLTQVIGAALMVAGLVVGAAATR